MAPPILALSSAPLNYGSPVLKCTPMGSKVLMGALALWFYSG